jgi:hypothetical protein
LVNCLLSPAVQVPLAHAIEDEPAKLKQDEVRQVFIRHVPGVEALMYRDQRKHVLDLLTSAYHGGLQAYQGTTIWNHLLSLFRTIVHHGHDEQMNCARHLREVAEAFMDCQAVQARVVERVGLEIKGIRSGFQGLVERLIGEYKTLALRMLAVERIHQRLAVADANPTHYENRLAADLGEILGLDKDYIRLAMLDKHASERYDSLSGDVLSVAARCREIFDVDAVLQAFVSEVNAFSIDSHPESLPRLFIDWASEHLKHKHVVFDDATYCQMAIQPPLALAIFEVLFLGAPGNLEETYHGHSFRDLF